MLVDWQLFQRVCNALDQAGYRLRDGFRGLTIVPTPQGVTVGWSPSYTPHTIAGSKAVDYGQGIKAAMVAALATVLEQAGFDIQKSDAYLLVTAQESNDARARHARP